MDQTGHGIVVDFALIQSTNQQRVREGDAFPSSRPVLLIGARSQDVDSDGSIISKAEEVTLVSSIMHGHLSLFRSILAQVKDQVDEAGRQTLDSSRAFLLCTYLKPRYIHILAFYPAEEDGESPTMKVIDVLPLAMHCRAVEDLKSRMRLAICLFTLQRHVLRLLDPLSDLYWRPGSEKQKVTTPDEGEILPEDGRGFVCHPNYAEWGGVKEHKAGILGATCAQHP